MNKKVFIFLSSLLILFGSSMLSPYAVFAVEPISETTTVTEDDFSEIVKNFRTDVVVSKSGMADVTETIVYDFKDNQKHGIYRKIPLTDVVGTFDRLKIEDIEVVDEKGIPYQFTRDLYAELDSNLISLRIGDPDMTISGEHTYVIHYKLQNALGYFDDRTELYWNTTGDEWEVPIWESEAHIFLPGKVEESSLKLASYCGISGSKNPCVRKSVGFNAISDQTEVVFTTPNDEYLNVSEGMTVAVGFPIDLVANPTKDDSYFPELIKSFQSDIIINPDGTANVTERIVYDFKKEEKHGIYRRIPLTDGVGTFDKLKIKNVQVTDENGKEYAFEKDGGSFFGLNDEAISIKVGDPDQIISGLHTYIISYKIINALGYFDDRTELYWNTTGSQWEVPIWSSGASVTLPGKVEQSSLKFASYCGRTGSKSSCKNLIQNVEYNPTLNQTKISFTTPEDFHLGSYQGMTIAVGFPKNIVDGPSQLSYILRFISRYWYIPFPVFITLLWFKKAFLYWLRRREFYKKNTIIPEYDAGDMDPLETAGIINGGIQNENLSAQIISLAVRGYITIKNIDGEYKFTGTGKKEEELSNYDVDLLAGISGKSQSSLTNVFYMIALNIISTVTQSLSIRQYVEKSSWNFSAMRSVTSNSFPIIFLSLFLAVNPGVFIWLLVGPKFGYIFSVSCILIGLVSLIIKPRSNKLTDKGFEAERKLLGLKLYIDVAEDERIKFHNAPEKSPKIFEKLLPYAMIFGLEKKWAKQFEGIYTTPPTWYADSTGAAFSAGMFASSLTNFSSSTTSTLFSAPVSHSSSSGSSFGSSGSSSGSSGGGSSGGGGGGGGGGSW